MFLQLFSKNPFLYFSAFSLIRNTLSKFHNHNLKLLLYFIIIIIIIRPIVELMKCGCNL
jgi:hypothetical protein